jgi:hypothetical protein
VGGEESPRYWRWGRSSLVLKGHLLGMEEAWAAASMEEGDGADGVFGTVRKDGQMAVFFYGWQATDVCTWRHGAEHRRGGRRRGRSSPWTHVSYRNFIKNLASTKQTNFRWGGLQSGGGGALGRLSTAKATPKQCL